VWEFAQKGNYLYAAADTDGFYVFDISTPSAPTFVRTVGVPLSGAGTHTGATGTTLIDTGLSANDYWDVSPNKQWFNASTVVTNTTTATAGTVSDNTGNTITTNITWTTGDTYTINRTSTSYLPITGVHIIGNTLCVCGRNVGQSNPADIPVGIVATFDIAGANASNPVWLDSYRPPSMNPIPVVSGFYGNEWYQGMASKGNFLFLASQLNGLVVLSVATPSNITRVAQWGKTELEAAFPTHAADALYWECSRITYSDNWVYLANHGNGIMAIDVTNPAAPTGAVWIDALIYQSKWIRPRNVVARDGWLYVASNCNSPDQSSGLRGLSVLDISNPATVTIDDWIHVPMGDAYAQAGVFNGQGDSPAMGIKVLGDFAFVTNGRAGVVVYNITNPAVPTLVNLQANFLEQVPDPAGLSNHPLQGTNLYDIFLYKDSTDSVYAYYSDAKEPAGYELHNLYADQIIGGPAMAFTIGNDGSVTTPVGSTYTSLVHTAGSQKAMASCVVAATDEYDPTDGNSWVYQIGFWASQVTGAARKNWVQIHAYDKTTRQPLYPIGAAYSYTMAAGTTNTAQQVIIDILPVNLPYSANIGYCVAVLSDTGNGSGSRILSFADSGKPTRRSNVLDVNNVFDNPWVPDTDVNSTRMFLFAYGETVTGVPTLSTPYATRNDAVAVSIGTLNFITNLSMGTYTLSNTPTGIDASNPMAVTGTPTLDESRLVKMTASNSFGSSAFYFIWHTGTGGPLIGAGSSSTGIIGRIIR
jgi:hypothetical protein